MSGGKWWHGDGAVDYKTSGALIDFLHQWFKLPASQIGIDRDGRGQGKIVELAGCDADTVNMLVRLEAACPVN